MNNISHIININISSYTSVQGIYDQVANRVSDLVALDIRLKTQTKLWNPIAEQTNVFYETQRFRIN